MKTSGKNSGFPKLGARAVAIVLLMAFLVLTVGFSSPRIFSASAASWLDKVFGGFKPRPRVNYRKTRYLKSLSTKRKAYGIGRISKTRLNSRNKKSLIYRVPKMATRGTYRTMCVRTCDGYFFPVSFATTKGNFKKDARTCRSSCGAPARLYYYPNPGGEIKEMVAYKGRKKYDKLKNAFLFKKEFVADCRCRPEAWTKAAKDKHVKYARIQARQKKRLASRKSRSRKRYSKKRRLKRNSRYIRTARSKRRAYRARRAR